MTPMLSFENVNVAIADAPVLRNVSFSLQPGVERRAHRAQRRRQDHDRAHHHGVHESESARCGWAARILGPIAPHRRPWLGLGYAPEDRRLFSAFTVEENILLPGRVAKLNPEETRRRLERAYSVLPELKELAKRPAGSVSGGQGKMVALGRALMLGTRLLILDEPFQGLAPVLAQRYAEALRRLRSQDKDITLLITESNPKLLETFADVTLTIERGEISSRQGQ